jgi:putative transposase
VGESYLYLAVVLDLCSRRIVGWALADHLRSDLVVDAMRKALNSRRGLTDLIFHCFIRPQLIHLPGCLRQATSSLGCDRGSQYGSKAFRDLLKPHGVRQSMSARANPYHNAWTESFMGTLKAEMLQHGRFINAADAQAEIFAFIDGYYNTQRLHSSLNYQTPHQFERQTALNN